MAEFDKGLLASEINSLYHTELERCRRDQPRWYEALAFLSGNQWVFFNERLGILDEMPMSQKERGKARITVNKIRPITERILAQVTQTRIMWRTVPTTSSEAGRMAARGWERWLTYQWQNKGLDKAVRDELMLWALCTGTGWLRTLWNPKGGKMKQVRGPVEPDGTETSDTEEPSEAEDFLSLLTGESEGAEEEGEPKLRTEEIPEGDIEFSVRSNFNVFIDPRATRWEEVTWLLEASFQSVQELKELYPDLADQIVSDVGSSTPNYSKRVLQKMSRTFSVDSVTGRTADGRYMQGTGVYAGNAIKDLVLVKEFWTQPTREYPQGRYVMVVGSTVLRAEDNPYGRIPYVPFNWFPTPGSLKTEGLIPSLTPLQKQLNMSYSQLLTNVKIHGNPPWLIHELSRVDLNGITDRSGAIILHNTKPGYQPPTRLPVPDVTSQLINTIRMIEQQLAELSGLAQANNGINPEGSRSGSMLQVLIRANNEIRRPAIARFRESLTAVGKLVMEITRRYVKEDRLIPVIGRNGEIVVTEFTTRDIENGLDVFIVAGDGYPDDPVARADYLLGLLNTGLFDKQDRKVRKLFVEALEFGDIQSIYDDGETDERVRIHDENYKLLHGEQVKVKSYDLHMEHAELHAKSMRTPEAQTIFLSNPEIEVTAQAHLDEHLDFLSAGSDTKASPAPAPGAVGVGGMGVPPELLGALGNLQG